MAGTDGVVHIPASRFDLDVYLSGDGEDVLGKSYTKHGGFCADDDIFCFDNAFFGISDDEAFLVAPCQRVVLEAGYECLSQGDLSKKTISGRNCGVFVGDCGSDWAPRLRTDEKNMSSPYTQDACSGYATASRLSYTLGLTGTVLSVDTACSSSLVAACTAMGGLRRPDDRTCASSTSLTSEALALGINTIVSPYWYVVLIGPLMLSRKGRCFTFDEHGDGYERGEGCSVVYLKRASAVNEWMQSKARLLGCCVNQDGRSATLTAPHGPSQTSCIQSSLREAGVPTDAVSVAECHGTGTALGDPIEVGAL